VSIHKHRSSSRTTTFHCKIYALRSFQNWTDASERRTLRSKDTRNGAENVAGVTAFGGNKVSFGYNRNMRGYVAMVGYEKGIYAFRYEVDLHVSIPGDWKIMAVGPKKFLCSWQHINSFSSIRGLLESVKEIFQ
jgi:hypothetical protein